ncbi:uncharacterized protein LOC143018668 [Oratosquilla oratoria]|uniref:uncharacterized protein LOC143018668 n=1 Tax=Oratosquilla oratoria TaxID=337810 RepID=UPI003F7739C4
MGTPSGHFEGPKQILFQEGSRELLEQRLRGLVEEKIGKWQHGFRPGKGTVDLIFAMKLLLEKDWEWNKDKYAVFIDMEKAFDRVPRKKLWEALGHEEYGIPGKLKRAIQSILHETMSKVRGRDMESEWFEVRTEARTLTSRTRSKIGCRDEGAEND